MIRPQKAKRLREIVLIAERILESAKAAEFGYLDGGKRELGTRLHFLSLEIVKLFRAVCGIKLTDAEVNMIPNPPKVLDRVKEILLRKSQCSE